jgi:hypothetical protein
MKRKSLHFSFKKRKRLKINQLQTPHSKAVLRQQLCFLIVRAQKKG